MRSLFTFALTLGIAASGAAQGQGEIIIRRPGVPDRVIRLDSSAARAELNKVEAQLRELSTKVAPSMRAMAITEEPRFQEMQRTLKSNLEASRTKTLAFRDSELASTDHLMALRSAIERRQPHLGVQVSVEPRETDKYGAAIITVTPGSPAEKAGILAGDVITKIAGKSLAAKDAKEESNPGLRLISIIATLTVGKPADVELRRGTQTVNVKVTPVEDGSLSPIARMTAPSMAEISRLPTDRLRSELNGELSIRGVPAPAMQKYDVFTNGNSAYSYSFNTNGLFGNIELTALNEKLGSYFGTNEGVLVVNVGAPADFSFMPLVATGRAGAQGGGRGGAGGVARGGAIAGPTRDDSVAAAIRKLRASTDSVTRKMFTLRDGRLDTAVYISGTPITRRAPFTMGLEPGDVIVSVDGRKVTSPSQLMRIVGTYEHNDEFKLQIMRQKRSETLTVKMP